MRVIFLTVFLHLFFIDSNAQSNYQPGLVHKNAGEIIKGWIDYRAWEKNPKEIRFKENENDEAFVYTCNDISLFEITNKDTYVKAIVSKDIRPVELEKLSVDTKDSIVNETVFLRVLVQADKLSLYALNDDKEHFYIKDTAGKYEELVYKVYLKDEQKLTYLEEKPVYRRQLSKYILNEPDFDKLVKRLNTLKYEENELSSFVRTINKDVVSSTVKKPANKPVFFISGGVLFAPLHVEGSKDVADLSYSTSLTPTFGIGMDIFSSRNLSDFTIRLAVKYSSLNYKGNKTDKDWVGTETEKLYSLKVTTITPELSILYNFVKGSSYTVYGGLGVGYNLSSFPLNEYVEIKKATNDTSKYSNYLPFEKNWTGLSASIGAVIKKKFELTAGTRILGSFANFASFGFKPSMYTLAFSYRFNNN